MIDNIIMLTDSYKASHWKQYPPSSQTVYSYMEARGGIYEKTLFFGLQYYIKKYLMKKITHEDINNASYFWNLHFNDSTVFNEKGWRYIVEKHNGLLPIIIKAIPEGSIVPTGTVLMTIENTDENVPWLTNYLETLLMQVWYPTTVATQSYHMKKDILHYLKMTGDESLIDYKLHDFGFRGSTSVESSAIGSAAHLVNFKGTDTFTGIMLASMYYRERMAGSSIPAAEHSTITSWGRDNELQAFENMLDSYPTGPVAVVSDSYNIYNACSNLWGEKLKDKIMNRNGVLVIRPDSGNPLEVLPNVLSILSSKFGYSINDKGFKVLDPHVRVIQGDGIDANSIPVILEFLKNKGWSADNIAFGSGGGLLQKVNRDTCKFAIKCSAIQKDGSWYDVYKDPITDENKKSKRGRFFNNNLKVVYLNGTLLNEQTFSGIRNIVNNTK